VKATRRLVVSSLGGEEYALPIASSDVTLVRHVPAGVLASN